MNRLTVFALACARARRAWRWSCSTLIWLGVILLFAFIVAGVFLIADPEFLAREED